MSGSVIRRHTYGARGGNVKPFIGIVANDHVSRGTKADDVVRVLRMPRNTFGDGEQCGAVLTDWQAEDAPAWVRSRSSSVIFGAEHLEHLKDGDVVRLDFGRGLARTLYRVGSQHNTIFATDRCNSNCLMCSQPPKDVDDEGIVQEHLRLIQLIPPTTESIGITGGEPTLLGDGLMTMLSACKENLPLTRLHMLTNGRTFSERRLAANLAAVGHPNLVLGIPLYSDVSWQHDYIVQAAGAFTQTMIGFHNLARFGVRIEVRVVVHQQTWKHLARLSEFIYRNLPFVEHVAFMGLEMMGYTKTNLKALWIDPADYQEALQEAVEVLDWAGMHVSIYNHQLCVLRESLWRFSRKAISDFKNLYLDECSSCSVLDRCGGLFKSSERIHSAHIRPLTTPVTT
jgi:His-Xaa-Ser system radical SAM maturase HxsC